MNLNALTESTKTHYQANPTIANVALNYPQGIAFVGSIYWEQMTNGEVYQVLDGVDANTDEPYRAVRRKTNGVFGAWQAQFNASSRAGSIHLITREAFWVVATSVANNVYPAQNYPYWYVTREVYSDGYVKLGLTNRPAGFGTYGDKPCWVTYSQLELPSNLGAMDGTIAKLSMDVNYESYTRPYQGRNVNLDRTNQKVIILFSSSAGLGHGGFYPSVNIEYMPDLVYPPTNPRPRP